MRFLVAEKTYERPISAGKFVYLEDGAKSGTVEQWRITQTPEQDVIVRVDLDARGAGGSSYVYHCILDGEWLPQRLTYRTWLNDDVGSEISGNVLFDGGQILNSRVVFGERIDEAIDGVAASRFFFPATMGLHLLRKQGHAGVIQLTTLNMYADDDAAMQALVQIEAEVVSAETWQLTWPSNNRTLTLRPDGYITQMQRQDGLIANAAHTIVW